jgi:hypothetical protein
VEWIDSEQNGVAAFCSNRQLQFERSTVNALLTCLSQPIQRSCSQASLNPRKMCRTLSLSSGATLKTRRPDLGGLTPTSPPDRSNTSGSPLATPSDRKQHCPMRFLSRHSLTARSVSKRALQLSKLTCMCIYSEDIQSVLNCHNVAKHTECDMGIFTVQCATGNTGCFKKVFTMVFQMLLLASVTKTFILKGVPSSIVQHLEANSYTAEL